MSERDIFIAASQKESVAERAAFLNQACGDDLKLRGSVEALLREREKLGGFLEEPASELARVARPSKEVIALDVAARFVPGEMESHELGDFRILREIGRGGMGVVYEAEQSSLGRRVALKVLPYAAVMDPRQLARFKTEAQAAASLHHSNIVPVYSVGSDGGVHFYAMQFVEGQTLAEIIEGLRESSGLKSFDETDSAREGHCSADGGRPRTDRTDSPETASIASLSTDHSGTGIERFRYVAQLGVQAAGALDHAHKHGVLHRDIKPGNLILDASGHLWITDFGLARFENDVRVTVSGDLIGTLRYMSPEQALAKRLVVDHRTDIYSLGVTLYELLSLRPAYDGRSREELLRQIAFDEPRPLRHWDRRIPRELELVVFKAIAMNPWERYETAADLADDLQRFLDDKPVMARRPTLLQRTTKWSSRHKALVSSLTAAVALMLITVAVASMVVARAERASHLATERAKARAEANADRLARRLAAENIQNAQNWCLKGNIDTGLLWFAHSLEMIPEGDADLQQCVRTNLAAWSSRIHKLNRVLEHGGDVLAVAYSLNGKMVATGSEDKTARLWNLETGKPIGPPLQHPSPVSAIAFSADGSQCLTGTMAGTSQTWDVATGRQVGKPVQHAGKIRNVSYGDTARILVQTAKNVLQISDPSTGQPVGQPLHHPSEVLAAMISPDGTQILTGCEDKKVRLWNAVTGEANGEPFFEDDVVPKPSRITSVAFSPDGSRILAAGEESWVRFWGIRSREPRGWVWIAGVAHDMALSPDSAWLLAGLHGATIQDVEKKDQHLGQTIANGDRVLAVAYAPDGTTVVTGSRDDTARVWQVARTATPIRTIPREGKEFSRAVAVSPDGSRLLRAYGKTARVWNVANGKPVGKPLEHATTVYCVAFSPDGSKLLTGCGDGTAHVWDATTHEKIGKPLRHEAGIRDVSFSPDGKSILTASADTTAQRWDTATLEPIGEPLRHDGGLYIARFSPDSSRIFTAPWDNAARLWNATDSSVVAEMELELGEIASAAFSPDGSRLVTGSWTVRLWDGHTGVPIGEPFWHEADERISGVAFSPDGKYVLTANGKAQLWDVATGLRIGPPIEEQHPIRRVAFSPDGSYMLTHGRAADTRLWKPVVAAISGVGKRVTLWTEVITGMELNRDTRVAEQLGASTWHRRRRHLQELGGAPNQ